ncbi:MAG: hypothetical protein QOF89_6129 [Acidobacteriota bacterium]|jgi:hypothetical protein|nr:hypothetical protein [Acidobacteriota bacterium]
MAIRNVYFDLTEELNTEGEIAVLASGQAVVFHRVSMMSKDGAWILRETPEACRRALSILERHGARYRPGAPLDVRWLTGGWSSHFEFTDAERRRIRCDFVTRPPRMEAEEILRLFDTTGTAKPLPVLDIEPLIRIKQTQRAKDYPVIGELARLLPPEREIEFTTDPDRILALASAYGEHSRRAPVRAALGGGSREAVVVALARELDRLQQQDRARLEKYRAASVGYLREFQVANIADLPLLEAHERLCKLAERWLPHNPLVQEDRDGAAQ